MRADKNSFRRGTRPISQNHFQILNSLSCQIHIATELLLDLGASIQTKAITTAAEQTTQVQRPAPVRPVTSTDQTCQDQVTLPTHARSPGHNQRQTGSPVPQRRVTRPTPGVGHRSDRSLTNFSKLVQNLSSRPRWKSQAVDQTGTSQTRS